MSKTVFILMDCQNGILGLMPDVAKAFLPNASRALSIARTHNIQTIFVKVQFRHGYPEVDRRNKIFNGVVASNTNMFVEGDPSTEFPDEAKPQDGDIVVHKKRFSAFAGTELKTVLNGLGATKLVFAGVSTSGVVLGTMREAVDMDYEVVVLKDACADREEDVHRVLTEKVFPAAGADVLTMEEWEAGLKG